MLKLPVPPEFILLFILMLIMYTPLRSVSDRVNTPEGRAVMVIFAAGIARMYGVVSGVLAAVVFIMLLHEGKGSLISKGKSN